MGSIRTAVGRLGALGATFALISPIVLLALSGVAVAAPIELTAFTDSSTSLSMFFDVDVPDCPAYNTSASLTLPYNAVVSSATLDIAIDPTSASELGTVKVDAGDWGSASVTYATLNITTAPIVTFDLGAADINAYVQGVGAASGDVVVPLNVSSCPDRLFPIALPGSWLLQFTNLSVVYDVGASPAQTPMFSGSMPPLFVEAGSENLSAADLSLYFSDPNGDPLTYSAQLVAASQPIPYGSVSVPVLSIGLDATVNGSRVELRSTNDTWWGDVFVEFIAYDPGLLSTSSGAVSIQVTPTPDIANRTGEISRQIYAPVVAVGCGVVHTEHFDLPDDAVITHAGMRVSQDVANSTALDFTMELRAGAGVAASNNSSTFTSWLGAADQLSVAPLNEYLRSQTPVAGQVGLDMDVWICPVLGVAAFIIDVAMVTYLRETSNGTGANETSVPQILGISLNGGSGTSVEVGAPVRLEAFANGTFGANVTFTWLVDGIVVSHERTFVNSSLLPGEHTVEVQATDGTIVRSFSTKITVAARPAPSEPFGLAWIAAALGLATVGLAAARTERGSWLILGVIGGSVFARLKRASLLDHFSRGALYQVIRENPGVHFAELRRRTQLANGAASHHLRMLEKGGYVRVVIDGTKTRFYATDRPLDEAVYGISDTDRAVLDAVVDAPGISQGELVTRVNRSASAVSRSVARLVSLGYVTTAHEGARIHIFPRPGAEGAAAFAPIWPDEGS